MCRTRLSALQQSRARYQAAQKSRVLQEQTLDAEQKKYALGASTIFFVIQAQRDLAQAQAVEVAALSTYNRARVSLDQATGQILTTYNVSVDEAMKGSVSRPPSLCLSWTRNSGRGSLRSAALVCLELAERICCRCSIRSQANAFWISAAALGN